MEMNPRSLLALLVALVASFLAGNHLRVGFAADSVFGLSNTAMENGGSLVICGGGEMPDAVNERFIQLAGGKAARLVIIATGKRCRDEAELRDEFSDFFEMNLPEIHLFNPLTREDVENEEFCAPLRRATGVWIGGGAQGRLADMFRGSLAEKLVHQVLEQGGVVGGTSAGASVMSTVMIRHGSSTEAVFDRGLGLANRTVIDQHFRQRNRQPRLIAAVEKHPHLVGLGIDEETAAVIKGNQMQVLGAASVFVVMGETPVRSEWSRTLSAGEKITLVAQDMDEEGTLLSVAVQDTDDGAPDDEEEV
jgi:cyanophycinase